MFRAARIGSIVLVILGVIAIALVLAWSLHIRDNVDEVHPGIKGGFVGVVFLLGTKWLVALGTLIVLGIGLAVAMIRDRPWIYPTTAILGVVMLGGVWLARLVVVHMEDPRFRARSPWVHAATDVALVATLYLVLVIAAAAIVWRRRPR